MKKQGINLPATEQVFQLLREGQYARVCDEFRSLANSLHKSFENDCNYGLTERQQKREDRLVERVHELAKQCGLYSYIQTDPRGGTIYVDDKPIPENNYTQARFIA